MAKITEILPNIKDGDIIGLRFKSDRKNNNTVFVYFAEFIVKTGFSNVGTESRRVDSDYPHFSNTAWEWKIVGNIYALNLDLNKLF